MVPLAWPRSEESFTQLGHISNSLMMVLPLLDVALSRSSKLYGSSAWFYLGKAVAQWESHLISGQNQVPTG